VRVRLAGIDAPELGQPYSRRARSPVGFVFGKDVTLIVQDRDRYGRTVVQVKVADLEVSAELVRIGAAWAYRAYLTDRTLLNLEAVAKEFKRGLCPLSKAERKAPWDWRKAKRGNPVPGTASKRPSPPVASQGGFSCSVIKSCAQMSGCAEARFQLRTCRNPRIDGDGDGIPCEAICRYLLCLVWVQSRVSARYEPVWIIHAMKATMGTISTKPPTATAKPQAKPRSPWNRPPLRKASTRLPMR